MLQTIVMLVCVLCAVAVIFIYAAAEHGEAPATKSARSVGKQAQDKQDAA